MTKAELTGVLALARDHSVSLADADHAPLFGLYTPEFKAPVTVTRRVAARMVRELVVAFNGDVNAEALAEFGRIARHRVLVVG